MKKKLSLIFMTICTAAAFVITSVKNENSSADYTPVWNSNNHPLIIIDAGHGGLDNGATAYDGKPEKTYNLSLAKALESFFSAAGYDTVMTREDDGDTDGKSGFDKKLDIANRLALANADDNRIFISIHLNLSYSPADKGFQVFYGSKNPESKILAETIRNKMKQSDLCTRVRDVYEAPSDIFLQHNIKVPCVLVECGFISNVEDYSRIKSEEYRTKLMYTLFCGITEYLQ